MTHFLQQVVLVPHDSPTPRVGRRGADTVEEGYVRRLRWYSAVGMAQQQYFVVKPDSNALFLYDSRQDMVQCRPRTRIMLKDVVTAVHHLEDEADSMGGRRFDVVTMHKLVRLVGETNMLARRWVRSVLDAVTNWQRKKRALHRAAIGERRRAAEGVAESQSQTMPQALANSGRDSRTYDLVGELGTEGDTIGVRAAKSSARIHNEIGETREPAAQACAGGETFLDTDCNGHREICAAGVEASRASMLTGARESQHKHHQQIAQKIHAATSRRRDGALATPLHRDRRRESQLEAAQYFCNPTTLRQLKTRRTSAPSMSNGVEQNALPPATSLHASISLVPGDKAAGPTAETSVRNVTSEVDDTNDIDLSPMPYDSDESSSLGSTSDYSDTRCRKALDESSGTDSDAPIANTVALPCSSSPITAGWRPQLPASKTRHNTRGNAGILATTRLEGQRCASLSNVNKVPKSVSVTREIAAITTAQNTIFPVETERSRVLRTLVGVQQVGPFNLNPCWDPHASTHMDKSMVLQFDTAVGVGQRVQPSGMKDGATIGADKAALVDAIDRDMDNMHHNGTAVRADDARTQNSVSPLPSPRVSTMNRHERLAKLAALRQSRRIASRPAKLMDRASAGACSSAAASATTTRPAVMAPCEQHSLSRNSPRFSLRNLPETGRFVLQATPEQLSRVGSAIRLVGVTRFKEVFDSVAGNHDIEKTLTFVEHEYAH